jgi:integrase/recombinase XerD
MKQAALPELAQAYIEHLLIGRGLSENSIASYRNDLKVFLDFTKNAIDVPAAKVAAFSASRAKEDSPKTQARRLSALRGFYKFLLERGAVKHDPTAGQVMPKLPKSLPKALSGAEVKALLSTAEGSKPQQVRLRLVFHLLYASGLRISELVHLTLADVDAGVESGVLRVTGKGDKTRVVPLGKVAEATLEEYRTLARPHLPGSNTDWLFPSPYNTKGHGKPMTRQSFWKLISEAGQMVGVKVAPHHLRHTFATHLVEHDADLRAVQLMLGHASLNTTQVYTKVAAGRMRSALETNHPLARGKGK